MLMTRELVIDAPFIAAMPWEPYGKVSGVRHKVLWRDVHGSYAGLLWLEPGAGIRRHEHPRAAHHLYVVHGWCVVEGRQGRPDARRKRGGVV